MKWISRNSFSQARTQRLAHVELTAPTKEISQTTELPALAKYVRKLFVYLLNVHFIISIWWFLLLYLVLRYATLILILLYIFT